MKCLCCGKPLKTANKNGWHTSCIKRFFGTTAIPEIEISKKNIEDLITETTSKGLSVPGVQKKLSLHLYSQEGKPRLTLVNYPAGYILKPQEEEFEALPEAEQLVMCMAEATGLFTVPHALVKTDEQFAYITKRIDRQINGTNVKKLGMEDFCQLDLRSTADKYKGSYERCAKIIKAYSSRPKLDTSELFLRLVFSFITGNSDMHLKNFSLIETDEGSSNYVLSPAYDLLPINVIMPEDKEELALTLNGKKANIHKNDFLAFAENCGITKKSAEKMIKRILSMKEEYVEMCLDSYLPEHLKSEFIDLINIRAKALE